MSVSAILRRGAAGSRGRAAVVPVLDVHLAKTLRKKRTGSAGAIPGPEKSIKPRLSVGRCGRCSC